MDGFSVILGSYTVHFAAFLVLATVIRGAPDYEDPLRQSQADTIYWTLMSMHLVIGGVKYASLFLTKFFWDKMTIFIILVVVITCYLQGTWIYDDIPTITQEQAVFELWL